MVSDTRQLPPDSRVTKGSNRQSRSCKVCRLRKVKVRLVLFLFLFLLFFVVWSGARIATGATRGLPNASRTALIHGTNVDPAVSVTA